MKTILHLFTSGSNVYANEFISFIVKNKSVRAYWKHYFISLSSKESYSPLGHLFTLTKDAFSSYPQWIMHLLFKLKKADLIIVHGLFSIVYEFLLAIFPSISKKVIWIIWGGDLYNPLLRRDKNAFDRLSIFRRALIHNAKGFASIFPKDLEIVKRIYQPKGRYFEVFYPNPLNFDLLEEALYEIDKKSKHGVRILLGNSSSITNNHFEAIDYVSRNSNLSNQEVLCPLAYGDKFLAERVIRYGKTKIGKQFTPIVKFCKPVDYARFLSTIDIAIMYHQRPQAAGTIFALLYLGKSVFLKKSNPLFLWLKSKKINVYAVETTNFSDFLSTRVRQVNSSYAEHQAILKQIFGISNCVQLWVSLFDQS